VTEIDFTDPAPESAFARVAVTGTGGGGKTWTSLLLARGMAGPDGTVGLVDTEHKTASKYRKYHDFKVCNLDYYDPRHLIAAVAKATERGLDALVVDSFSHFWSGAGGILAQVDLKAGQSYSGNNFAGWKDVRPMETEMMTALLSFPGHLIVTMRVKPEWVLETQANGRTKPVKLGLKPEQRDGIDYEWDLVGGLDTEHVLTVTKTRIHEISMGEMIANPDIEFGARIAAALREGATPPAVNAAVIRDWRARLLAEGVTRDEIGVISRDVKQAGALGIVVTGLGGGTVSMEDLIRQQWRITPAVQAPAAVTSPAPAAPDNSDDAAVTEWAERFAQRAGSYPTALAGESLRDELQAAVQDGTCPLSLEDQLKILIDKRMEELDPVREPAADDPVALLRAQIATITTQTQVNKARTAVNALQAGDAVKRELFAAIDTRWAEVKAGGQ
jgi:hypothetical protein